MNEFDEAPVLTTLQQRRLLLAVKTRLDQIADTDDVVEKTRRAWLMTCWLQGYIDSCLKENLIREQLAHQGIEHRDM